MLVRFVRAAPGMSFVLYSDLDEKTADVIIDDQIDYFTRYWATVKPRN